MHCITKLHVLALSAVLAGALPAAAQSRLSKQVNAGPGSPSGPATLEATMTSYGAWIRWPPVTNATAYNVTRVNHIGSPEVLISSRATSDYAFEGNNCAVGNAFSYCVYFDNQFRTTATKLAVTYRVYAVIPGPKGPVTSPPSPGASLVWNCPNCPRVP